LRSKGRKKTRGRAYPLAGFARTLNRLRNLPYNTAAEYHSKVSEAALALGNAASALTQLEAAYAASRHRSGQPRHRTLEVYPTGDGSRDYAKIQKAVDIASSGDRILLKSGVFRASGAVWVWKDVALEGESGTVIEGTTQHHGKVIADPALNGGFIVTNGASVEIRNIGFRLLYFAAASQGGFNSLVFEDNSCEDVYHCVYVTAADDRMQHSLRARCNRISVSSLNPQSSRCRLNFYEESHLFGIYCQGPVRALIEGNRMEVNELTNRQPFHAIAAFCSEGCSAVIRDNLFKGWHSAVSLHGCPSPIVSGNEIHGLCEDAEFKPIGMLLGNCDSAAVVANRISNRGLGSGAIGIALAGCNSGRVLDNHLSLARDAEAGILLYRGNDSLLGQNSVAGSHSCSLGLFGDQSEDAKRNILFGNSLEGRAEIRMRYASENTVLGQKPKRNEEDGNSLLGYEARMADAAAPRLEGLDHGRHRRVMDHAGRKRWPEQPVSRS
jgi:nitrous oxidase accessory protein NosD